MFNPFVFHIDIVLDYSIPVNPVLKIVGILTNIGIAYYISKEIQSKNSESRALKDHLISEIKALKRAYEKFYKKALKGDCDVNDINRSLKSLNRRGRDIFAFAENKKDPYILMEFHTTLRNTLTESLDFQFGLVLNEKFRFPSTTRIEIQEVMERYESHFNDFIRLINSSRKI